MVIAFFFGGSSVNSIDEIWKCMDEIWIGSGAGRIVALGNRLCNGSGFLFYAWPFMAFVKPKGHPGLCPGI